VAHYLATGEHLAAPLVAEVRRLLLDHLAEHHGLYGEYTGVRSARKHIGWYVSSLPAGRILQQQVNTIETAADQLAAVDAYFRELALRMDRLPPAPWQIQEAEEVCA
jgi:tRNA-dihydrouridine synthase B